MVRKRELLLTRWEHVDFDCAEWRVPAEHSKTGKPHAVPEPGAGYLLDRGYMDFARLHALHEAAPPIDDLVPARGESRRIAGHDSTAFPRRQGPGAGGAERQER